MILHPAYPVEPWCLRETELHLDVLAHVGWSFTHVATSPAGAASRMGLCQPPLAATSSSASFGPSLPES